jgi:hypothetical protein
LKSLISCKILFRETTIEDKIVFNKSRFMSLPEKLKTSKESKISKREVQVNLKSYPTNKFNSSCIVDKIQYPQETPTEIPKKLPSPVPRLKKLDSSNSSHSFYSLETVKSLDSSSDIIGLSPSIVKVPESPSRKLEDSTCSKFCISDTTTEDSIVDCVFSNSLPTSKDISIIQSTSPISPTSNEDMKSNTLLDISAYIIKKKSLHVRFIVMFFSF